MIHVVWVLKQKSYDLQLKIMWPNEIIFFHMVRLDGTLKVSVSDYECETLLWFKVYLPIKNVPKLESWLHYSGLFFSISINSFQQHKDFYFFQMMI